MKRLLVLSFWIAGTTLANGQKLSAEKLIDMLSLSATKSENLLLHKNYHAAATEISGDTVINTFEYYPVIRFGKKKHADTASRKLIRSLLKETFVVTYRTTSAAEYSSIIRSLKNKGFYCEYEKDSTITPVSYFYQQEDHTADASVKMVADTAWYSISFHKKSLPVDKELHFAEDLLQFTSHEYLVYYFGEKNVKKDFYYFGENDIVKCSVLLINTNRQVIFIWKDGLNSCKIDNLLFGGQHKLKSQKGSEKFIAENSWPLKSGINAGMPLFDLRALNEKNIAFCGGDTPNPGMVFPESSGKVDFKNKEVILACMNCKDDKYLSTKIIYADKAMEEGLIFFILTIVLYPDINRIFE